MSGARVFFHLDGEDGHRDSSVCCFFSNLVSIMGRQLVT